MSRFCAIVLFMFGIQIEPTFNYRHGRKYPLGHRVRATTTMRMGKLITLYVYNGENRKALARKAPRK